MKAIQEVCLMSLVKRLVYVLVGAASIYLWWVGSVEAVPVLMLVFLWELWHWLVSDMVRMDLNEVSVRSAWQTRQSDAASLFKEGYPRNEWNFSLQRQG